jgi:hypothetical protein
MTVERKDIGERPACSTIGCYEERCYVSTSKKGIHYFNKFCRKCKEKHIKEKHGVDNIRKITSQRNGFGDDVTAYLNSKHPDRQFRKTYCENVDGRLGFRCTTTILIVAQLHADHIDGNPSNKTKENIQTLCACCHVWKTLNQKDYATPGRKTLGVK